MRLELRALAALVKRRRRIIDGGGGGGGGDSFDQLPSGWTIIGNYDNPSLIDEDGFVDDGNPFRALSQATTGFTTATLTFSADTITASSGGNFSTSPVNVQAGQYVEISGTGGANDGVMARVIAVTALTIQCVDLDGGTSPFTVIGSASSGGWGIEAAWGKKTLVSSGYGSAPPMGGPSVMLTTYPRGVQGGFDAGRLQCSVVGTPDEIFGASMIKFASDYPFANASGGNKQLFVTTNSVPSPNRIFVNLDSTLIWNVYIGGATVLSTTSVSYTPGAWVKLQVYMRKPTGADNDGILRLWIDSTLAVDRTDLSLGGGTFPLGNFSTVYDDGSNNGNRYLTGVGPELRTISTPYPGEIRTALRWTSRVLLAVP